MMPHLPTLHEDASQAWSSTHLTTEEELPAQSGSNIKLAFAVMWVDFS